MLQLNAVFIGVVLGSWMLLDRVPMRCVLGSSYYLQLCTNYPVTGLLVFTRMRTGMIWIKCGELDVNFM
jgi:hypothetical protein